MELDNRKTRISMMRVHRRSASDTSLFFGFQGTETKRANRIISSKNPNYQASTKEIRNSLKQRWWQS
jgi:hypothetical protein